MRRALITGIGGQDGSYLAELLLAEGYEVFGMTRRDPRAYENLSGLLDRVEILEIDLLDQGPFEHVLDQCRPHEIYNLASDSFVPRSWEQPLQTSQASGLAVTVLLEAIRAVAPETRLYQASSSEIFGQPEETPQNETTPLRPVSPYGVAKAYAHLMAQSYRRRYGLFACCGIAYNHESPRRPFEFLPRKVARSAAAISLGLESELVLGDLKARRDWGYAPDYVRAMRLMLQQDEPGDYVLASGQAHSVRALVAEAFGCVGLRYENHVRVDPLLHRGSAELHGLVGNASRAREKFGWEPSLDFAGLVQTLVEAEIARLAEGSIPLRAHHR